MELQRIAREGKRIRTTNLEVRVIVSPRARSGTTIDPNADLLPSVQTGVRVGLIVAKHRQSAVNRNRLKRRLRELVRHQLLPLSISVDLVIRSRPESYAASFDALYADMMTVAAQLKRWNREQTNGS